MNATFHSSTGFLDHKDRESLARDYRQPQRRLAKTKQAGKYYFLEREMSKRYCNLVESQQLCSLHDYNAKMQQTLML